MKKEIRHSAGSSQGMLNYGKRPLPGHQATKTFQKKWSYRTLLVSEVQDGEQFLAHPGRGMRIGIAAVEENRFLQAIEIRRAVRATFQVILDHCGSSSGNLPVKLFFKVPGYRFARVRMSMMLFHGEK